MLLKPENRGKLFAVILIVAITGGVLFLAGGQYLFIATTADLGGDAQCSYTYELVGVDEDGNEIKIPVDTTPLQSAFKIGGIDAVSVILKTGWSASGDGVQWDTFSLDGSIKISILTGLVQGDSSLFVDGAPVFAEVRTITFSSNEISSNIANTLVLGVDIADMVSTLNPVPKIEFINPPTGDYWYYKFECSITATVLGTLGETITETKTLGSFGVMIVYGADLSLAGSFL